ncbi:MAG: 2-isopropylmalate synthase [Firmicutes bacterium]|nr:2-isopropylmalate synthase [Bacillota bacterium]
MRHIKILDTTLRDGEQAPGCSMQLNEKLDIAKSLESLNVDIIEAGFAASSKGELESIKKISKEIKNCVISSLSRCRKEDIDASYEAVKHAKMPRIHIFIATSEIHLRHKLKMTQDDVKDRVIECVKYAKSKTYDVEFSCEDASRSDRDFLLKLIDTAIKCGATTINLPDTVGFSVPWEMYDLFSYVKNNIPDIDKITLSAHNHNDLGLGVSNSLACILGGATQVECTLGGIGERAGNASLEEIVMALKFKEKFFDASTRINTQNIYNSVKLLYNTIGLQIPPNKAIIGENAFSHESGIHQHGVLEEKSTYEILSPKDVGVKDNKIVLGKHSGRHAFSEYLKTLNYNFKDDEIDEYFNKFKILSDKKKIVTLKDIQALIDIKSLSGEKGYELIDFKITAAGKEQNGAQVTLKFKGKTYVENELGEGSLDAAFKAVNKICGHDFILIDYSLHSITEGEDAQGEAVVKMKYNNETIIARGVSTDIIEASILAYLNGVNKALFYKSRIN